MSVAEFKRDPEVEEAAVNLLGMTHDQVLCARIADLRDAVKAFVNEQEMDSPDRTLPQHINVLTHDRSTESPMNTHVLAPSELGMLSTEHVAEDRAVRGIRGSLAKMSLRGGEPDRGTPNVTQNTANELALLKKDERSPQEVAKNYLIMPINVEEWCNKSEGLKRFHEHVIKVLKAANEYEKSIREQRQVLALHTNVLDQEDIGHIESSIMEDMGELSVVIKWLSTRNDELGQVIKARLEVEAKLKTVKRGAGDKLCSKIRTKTLKMRALHTQIQARIETLHVPDTPTRKSVGGSREK